jgi:hypothetical protein
MDTQEDCVLKEGTVHVEQKLQQHVPVDRTILTREASHLLIVNRVLLDPTVLEITTKAYQVHALQGTTAMEVRKCPHNIKHKWVTIHQRNHPIRKPANREPMHLLKVYLNA